MQLREHLALPRPSAGRCRDGEGPDPGFLGSVRDLDGTRIKIKVTMGINPLRDLITLDGSALHVGLAMSVRTRASTSAIPRR
jgi:hypothetical protein